MWMLAAGLLLSESCGSGEVSARGRNALPIAFGLPRVIAMNTYASRSMVVEAVYQASARSGGAMMGRVVQTGTLQQGPMGFQYSPQPTDRLVVKLGSQTHEFVIKEAEGNRNAPNSAAWVQSPHRLHYVHRLLGHAEADITVSYDGSRFQAGVKGWQNQGGERFDVDLKCVGKATGVRDYHGQDVTTTYQLTGSITGQGVEVDVNETHSSRLVAATSLRLLYSQRGSASRTDVTINNTLRAGGSTFRFQDVKVVSDVKSKGGTGSAGVVSASGSVTHGGSPYGTVVLEGQKVYLETSSGPVPLDVPQNR